MIDARVMHAYLPGRRREEHDGDVTRRIESPCWCGPKLVLGYDELTGTPILAVVHDPGRWSRRRARRGEFADLGQVARIPDQRAEELTGDAE